MHPSAHSHDRLRLFQLDGLRGLLALYVAFYHLINSFGPVATWAEDHLYIIRDGQLPVDVFFVLSGFVMKYVYGSDFRAGPTVASLKRFFVARFARLYPVHAVTFGVLFVCLIPFVYKSELFLSPEGRLSWTSALANLVFLQGPWIDHRTWNYPNWSVSAEWHAYAIFPFVVAAFASRRIAAAAVILGPVVALCIYLVPLAGETYPTNGVYSAVRAIALFLAGVGLYSFHDLRVTAKNSVALAVVASMIALLCFRGSAAWAVVLVPALVLVTLNSPVLSAWFQHRSMVELGRISYSLYMVHGLVQILLVDRIIKLFGPAFQSSFLAAAVVVTLATALAVVVAHYMNVVIEEPARAMLNGWFVRRQKRRVLQPLTERNV